MFQTDHAVEVSRVQVRIYDRKVEREYDGMRLSSRSIGLDCDLCGLPEIWFLHNGLDQSILNHKGLAVGRHSHIADSVDHGT